MIDEKSLANRQGTLEIVKQKMGLFYEIKRIQRLTDGSQLTLLDLSNKDFNYHPISRERFSFDLSKDRILANKKLEKAINNIVERPPSSYESILMTKGVGPKTIRALTLISEVVFGASPSYEDPVRYTYAFSGKDGIPYPVNRQTYDQTIEVIEKAIKKSSILEYFEKEKLLRRNNQLFSPQ